MSYNFKETMNKPERLAPGHRMCAGCGGTIAVRNVLRGLHELLGAGPVLMLRILRKQALFERFDTVHIAVDGENVKGILTV